MGNDGADIVSRRHPTLWISRQALRSEVKAELLVSHQEENLQYNHHDIDMGMDSHCQRSAEPTNQTTASRKKESPPPEGTFAYNLSVCSCGPSGRDC
jgi:hypothetical protein